MSLAQRLKRRQAKHQITKIHACSAACLRCAASHGLGGLNLPNQLLRHQVDCSALAAFFVCFLGGERVAGFSLLFCCPA